MVGPARSESEVLALIRYGAAIDGAVLDINLGAGPASTLAQVLKDRAIRFVFATGYGAAVLPAGMAGNRRWEKPYDPKELADSLQELVQID